MLVRQHSGPFLFSCKILLPDAFLSLHPGRGSLCAVCPQEHCFTRKAADMALRGQRPYLDGVCTVCNFVLWKARRGKDGIRLLEMGGMSRRRPTTRAAREELEAALIAGAISVGSAYEFWLANLWEVQSLSEDGPWLDYVQRMVFPPPRAWKPALVFDVAWKWNGVRSAALAGLSFYTPPFVALANAPAHACVLLVSQQSTASKGKPERLSLDDVKRSLKGFVGEHGFTSAAALVDELTR